MFTCTWKTGSSPVKKLALNASSTFFLVGFIMKVSITQFPELGFVEWVTENVQMLAFINTTNEEFLSLIDTSQLPFYSIVAASYIIYLLSTKFYTIQLMWHIKNKLHAWLWSGSENKSMDCAAFYGLIFYRDLRQLWLCQDWRAILRLIWPALSITHRKTRFSVTLE